MANLRRENICILFISLLTLLTIGPAISSAAGSAPIAKPAGYPNKPIDVIVPYSPGGGADTSQRIFNKYAEPIVGQRLIIVSKPGAGGTRGWAELVRAKPDGYTLGIITPPFNVIPAVMWPKQTGYTLDQFTNICVYGVAHDLLYTMEGGRFKTLKDLIDYGKQNPRKVKASNMGTKSSEFMTTMLIEKEIGVAFTHVPFEGASGGAGQHAILAGIVDLMIGSEVHGMAQKGKLRPLAIAAEARSPQFPDVPTFKELGYDVVSERYRALAGPPKLSAEIVTYWSQVCKQTVDNREFTEAMEKVGQVPEFYGPEAASKAIDKMARDLESVKEMVDKANPEK